MYGYIYILLIIVILLAILKYTTTPTINDVWLINLKRRPDRLNAFRSHSQTISLPIHIWEATDGKEVSRSFATSKGIDCVVLTNNCYDNKDTITQYNGVVGCWLSHKLLLEHLAKLPVSNTSGHLICEDDVCLNSDVLRLWEEAKHELPHMYDMVYFGCDNIKGKKYSKHLVKLDQCTGTYCYIIRHGAIPKILEHLEHFTSAIDYQYSHMFKKANVYAFVPRIIQFDEEVMNKTDIQHLA